MPNRDAAAVMELARVRSMNAVSLFAPRKEAMKKIQMSRAGSPSVPPPPSRGVGLRGRLRSSVRVSQYPPSCGSYPITATVNAKNPLIFLIFSRCTACSHACKRGFVPTGQSLIYLPIRSHAAPMGAGCYPQGGSPMRTTGRHHRRTEGASVIRSDILARHLTPGA